MIYKPTKSNVFAQKVANELTTSFGIVLTESDESARAKVTGVGPDVKEVSVGDVILLNWKHAAKIGNDGLFCVPEEWVVAVIES